MTRRVPMVMAALLLVGACSAESAVTTTTAVPPSTTVTTAAPTTISSSSTTTSTSTTTTTTTLAPLDTGDAAAVDRMQADLEVLVSNGPRVAGTPNEAAAIRYVAFRAHAITGSPSLIQDVPLPRGRVSANAWAAPIGDGDVVLLLGAHIDSIAGSPGADDNGSGSVILLEVLRRLVESPPDGVTVQVVWFGAEEFIPGFGHHYGSVLAAAGMEEMGTLPDRMVSVDMVGIGSVLHAVDYQGAQPAMADDLVAIAADIGVEVVRMSRGDISDHVPFALAGVPAAILFRGDNPEYHEPGDDHAEDDALLETLAVVEALIAWFE